MSTTEHTTATLPGYVGPFFPESVHRLREQFDRPEVSVNGQLLNLAAQRLHGEISRNHSHTTDGYFWFWGIEFNNGNTVILIPWFQDWEKANDTQADRSIALYVRSDSPATADAIVEQFTLFLTEEIDRQVAAEAARRQAE